ncbi:MAG: DNA polymerase clamp loader subunit A [Candidatus Bathyarchaeia archaeon]
MSDEKKLPYDWRYENSINLKNEYISLDQIGEFKYEPFRTNRAFSNYPDTVIHANDMNINYGLDNRLQYDYLYYSIRKKKRSFKNRGKKNKDDTFSCVQEYYKYSNKKTHETLAVLNEEQIEIIRKKVNKGGIK